MDKRNGSLSRRSFAVLVALAGTGILTGCSTQTTRLEDFNFGVPETVDGATKGATEEEGGDDKVLIKGLDGVGLEYVLDAKGEEPKNWYRAKVHSDCYIEHGGLYYPLMNPLCAPVDDMLDGSSESVTEWTVAFVGGEKVENEKGEGFSTYDTVSMPIDVSGGDRLITLDANLKPALTPIDATIYYAPRRGFTGLADWGIYDEVDGVSMEGMTDSEKLVAVRQVLEGHGMFQLPFQECFDDSGCWVSEQPVLISVGDFSGTKWEESHVYIDKPLVVKPSGKSVIPLEVTKTHEGYFVIELANVPTGEYMLSDSSGMMSDFYGHIEWDAVCYRISIS